MPRHRESSLPDRPTRSTGIRIAATLTLVLGVAGGLYLGDTQGAQDAAAKESEVRAAEQAEQARVHADYVNWSRARIDERAETDRVAREAAAVAAAEQARLAEEEARKKAAEEAARGKPRVTNPTTYPIPASCDEYSGNRATGCALMLEAGYELDQMPCLEKLWTKESGWNEKSSNGGSGAYGIPQALPGSKMAAFGDDWQTNPVTQIKWGLSYIKSKYSTPCGAWATFQSKGWY